METKQAKRYLGYIALFSSFLVGVYLQQGMFRTAIANLALSLSILIVKWRL